MSKESIYTKLIERSSLTLEHLKELEEKRGFSRQTIQSYQFRSGNDQFISIVEKLKTEHPEKDLIEAGILVVPRNGKEPRVNHALLEDRIIIPYLNEDGQVYHLRPHKKGLKDVTIEVYQARNLVGNAGEIILTEGEFKAVAGMQYGIPTIAIPGIQSFSKTHLPRLVELLNRHKVRKITIIFDNEVKDDPQFRDRYKENPMDRYDTPLYACYMAQLLRKENFETVIGQLPNGWRVNGKIDIDGALAQKKTREEILRVMEDAKPQLEFRNELDATGRRVLEIKFARLYFKTHVSKEWGHYVAAREDSKRQWTEQISNFTLKILAKYRNSEGVMRDVQLVNDLGEHSATFTIASENMQDSTGFNTFCMSKGNFLWWGKKEDLFAIWKQEFLNDDGRDIEEPDHVGWVEELKCWVFGNVIIDADGKEFRPDKNGIFWMKDRGVKPVPLVLTTGRAAVAGGVPDLYVSDFNWKELVDRLSDTIGKEQTYVVFGWAIGVLFMEEIFDKHRAFPFLHLTGKRGSGKTTVAEIVSSLFGIEKGHQAADTTSVAVQRFFAYHSSIPFLLDEYRNEKKVRDKDGLLRNAYNRQSAGKGIKANFGIREGKIRGTVILSGEDIPADNALKTRVLEIYVSDKFKKPGVNHLNWYMANRAKFSHFTYDLLRAKKTFSERFMKELDADWTVLAQRPDLDPRVAINYAIVTAACSEVLGIKDRAFADWLVARATTAKQESEKTHALAEFLEGVLYLKQTGQIDDSFYDYDPKEGLIYLWFEGAFNKYQEYFTKLNREAVFSREAIFRYIKDEPYFAAPGVRVYLGRERARRRCVAFKYEEAHEHLKDLVEDRDAVPRDTKTSSSVPHFKD